MNPTDPNASSNFGFPRLDARLPNGSKAKYLKAYTRGWNDEEVAAFEQDLMKFANGSGNEREMSIAYAADRLFRVSGAHQHAAIQAALNEQPDWRTKVDRSTAYYYLATELDACQNLYTCVAAGGKAWGWLQFTDMLSNIVHCLSAGWSDQAAGHVQLLLRAYKWNCVSDHARSDQTQRFTLRLLADWQGVPNYLKAWPKGKREDPLFARLLELWCTPDRLDELSHLLLVAADRRMQHSSTSGQKHYDLRHNWFWYDPFEIVAVLKLRELTKLNVPTIDHPIMDSPLGRLMEPTTMYDDELLAAVRARCRVLHPDIGAECCANSQG